MFHRMTTIESATEDSPRSAQCFVCGGVWEYYDGEYVSALGHPAPDCTRNSEQYHHYATECSCPGQCVADPDCNCLACF
jgi:hypothetical protein